MRKLGIFLLLAATMLLSSCGGSIYQYYHSFPDKTWNAKDTVNFPVQLDAPGTYVFSILIRHTDNYPYNNMWVYVNIKKPDGSSHKERFNLGMADYAGRWLGQGPGKDIDNRFLVLPHLDMSAPGAYVFTLEQDMRDRQLKGVNEIGIRLKKTK